MAALVCSTLQTDLSCSILGRIFVYTRTDEQTDMSVAVISPLPYPISGPAVHSYLELAAVQSSSNRILSAQVSIKNFLNFLKKGQHNPGKLGL